MQTTIRSLYKRIKEGALNDIWSGTGWIYHYARRYWRDVILYTTAGLSSTVISLIVSLISKDLVDIITGRRAGQLIQTFCFFIAFSALNIIIGQISVYLSGFITIRIDSEIKADIFEKILVTDWESITSYHTGDLLSRWDFDASVISGGILNWFPNLIINLFRFLTSFIIILYYDTTFAFLALAGLPVSAIVSRSLLRRMHKNNKEGAAINAKITGFNQEAFSNIQTIKAFDIIHTYSDHLKHLQKEYMNLRLRFQKISMVTSITMSLIGIAVSNACYGWGIYLVWSGAVTYGTMTLFLSLSGSMTGNLNSLISMIPSAISIATSASRLKDILEMPREEYPDRDKVDRFYDISKETGLSLSIHNLNYTYHTGAFVFQNCSFEAHPNEVIALVGASGAGKTTLLRILLALLHPQEGECKLYAENDPFRSLPLSPATRRLFSYVPQGNTMFSGTIAQNMRNIKPNASDEEIIAALRAACAWEFIEKLPDGIHSMVGERGAGFSEGQSQRLSIARALLRKCPIILLDEATSALDSVTQERVLKGILQDEYPRTCIVTTHRPAVLKMCSRVYEIKDHHCRLLTGNEISNIA